MSKEDVFIRCDILYKENEQSEELESKWCGYFRKEKKNEMALRHISPDLECHFISERM